MSAVLTVAELTEKLVTIQNQKDEALAKFRKELVAVRKQRDAAIAREAALKKLGRMSEDEIAVIKAELGLEA